MSTPEDIPAPLPVLADAMFLPLPAPLLALPPAVLPEILPLPAPLPLAAATDVPAISAAPLPAPLYLLLPLATCCDPSPVSALRVALVLLPMFISVVITLGCGMESPAAATK